MRLSPQPVFKRRATLVVLGQPLARGDKLSCRAFTGGSEPGYLLMRNSDRSGGVFRPSFGRDERGCGRLERLAVVHSLQAAKAVANALPFFRLPGGAFERSQARFQLDQQVTQPRGVGVCLAKIALCLGDLESQTRQVRGMLEETTTFFSAQAQRGIDQTLSHDHVALAESGGEQSNVLQSHLRPLMRYWFSPDRNARRVTETSANSIGSQPSALSKVSLGHAGRGPAVAAAEDHVFGLLGAQRMLPLLAQNPAHSVGDVRLAAPVRSDDPGNSGSNAKTVRLRKLLKPWISRRVKRGARRGSRRRSSRRSPWERHGCWHWMCLSGTDRMVPSPAGTGQRPADREEACE